ncbi:VanZ family protein [bacterium]|nr:VanZ family protein [bacterium]
MKARVSTERYLWSAAILTTVSILCMAAWGRAVQHYIEKFFGKEILITITLFFVVSGGWLFYAYVIKNPVHRLRRFILFLIISIFYAWRLMSLHVHVERFHLIEYGILSILVCLASRRHNQQYIAFAWGFAAAWFVGLSDEFFQWWLPARVGEWRDVVINIQSGALGLAALGILQAGTGKLKHPAKKHIIWVLITFGFLSFISGQFILKIHVFGQKNEDINIGSFNSLFTSEQLLNATVKDYLKFVEIAGGHQSGKFITDHYLYFYEREAREHFDKTHLLIELNQLNKARSEYMLTQKYYDPWLKGTSTFYSDEIQKRLESVTTMAPDKYYSQVMDWMMVSTTRSQVNWFSIILTGVFFLLAAGYYRIKL